MKKAFITTLGCKVNQFESASFKTGFESEDIEITHNSQEADIIVVNTCTVTGKAGAQSRQAIRKAARSNHHARIVVTGCHAQLSPAEIRDLDIPNPERICIIGNDRKQMLVEHAVADIPPMVDTVNEDLRQTRDICILPVSRFEGRTRAYLRVQDGCNSFCSYCIVPFTRGRSRSLPPHEALLQAQRYGNEGHREIVVTGIHIGRYGRDLVPDYDIVSLLQQLCSTTPDMRYRLSSIEPLEISDELLALMSTAGNLMPHLHIPLQSGDNDILAAMNRRYSREQFAEIIHKCRSSLPDCAIGIDVLVGFPGEKDHHFENTIHLLEQIDCTYLHAFPYSKRPGTKAAAMADQVDRHVKSKRVELLRALGEQKRKEFYRKHCDTTREVLLESERDRSGFLRGFTDNYISLLLDGEDCLKNTIVRARLDRLENSSVIAYIDSNACREK